MQRLTPQQIAAITEELNKARCLERVSPGNIELTKRLVKVIEGAGQETAEVPNTAQGLLCAAVDTAFDRFQVSDVLSAITGIFVGVTVELVRQKNGDASGEIKIDGRDQRDITIHAKKG